MDEELAELWHRHLSNQRAIRGQLAWVMALLVGVILAVGAAAFAIVTAVNELAPKSPF